MVKLSTEMSYEEFVEKAKTIIDRTPDCFMQYHLDDCIKKEYFEIAAYIRDVAANRGLKLNT